MLAPLRALLPKSRRGERLVWAALAALAVFYFAVAGRTYCFDDDAARYVGLAESLVAGEGYSFAGVTHTRFPPGTALAYAPAIALAGRDFAWIHRVSALWSIAALAACYLWLRARGERRALALTLLGGTSAAWIEHSTGGSLSEAPFAALTYAALLAGELAARGSRRAAVALAACAAGAFLVRTVGIAWLVAALIARRSAGRAAGQASARAGAAEEPARRLPHHDAHHDAHRRAWSLAAGALACAALAWLAWTGGARAPVRAADFGHASTYAGQVLSADPHAPDRGPASLASLAARVGSKLAAESRHLAEILLHADWFPPRAWPPWTVLCLLAVCLGARAELRRANSAAGALFLTSFALLLVWPYDEGRRFLMPFVPLVLLLGWRGLREIVALARRRSRPVAGLLVALALGAALVGALELSLTARPVGTLDLVALAGWLLAAALGVLARWRAPWRERMASRLRARSAVALWLAVYLALGVPSVTAAVRRNHTPAEQHRQAPLRAASLWLAQHAGPGDVVLATTHAPLHFATGLRVRPLPVTADPARLLAAIADERPRFLVFLDPRPNEYLHPTDAARRRALEHAAPGAWREVHHADGFAILEPAETSTPAR